MKSMANLSSSYTKEYFDKHVDKYLNRNSNHQGVKISSIKEMTGKMHFETVLDLGCCVGTFALEYAADKKKTVGLDLSLYGLKLGKKLASAQKVQDRVNFINASASHIPLQDNCIDLILAEDIVEHLIPNLLRMTFKECYRVLKPEGKMIIHTFPTKFSHLLDLFELKKMLFLLYPLSFFPAVFIEQFLYIFEKTILPIIYFIIKRKSWKLMVLQSEHCNIQTLDSLASELISAKFEIINIYSTNLYKDFFKKKYFDLFAHSSVSKRNLLAVVKKP